MKLIIYPREYNKRGDSSLHSVMGVTEQGQRVNVKLRITKSFGMGEPPSIVELSRTDRKAKSPAIATESNSPLQREGVILFSDVKFDRYDKTKDVHHYIAGWANVISEDADSPAPLIGIGRIKINKDSFKINEIKRKIASSSGNDKSFLLAQLTDRSNYDFNTVVYDLEKQYIAEKEHVTKSETLVNFLNYNSEEAVTSGAYIIECNENGYPIPNRSREIFATYKNEDRALQSTQEILLKIDKHLDKSSNPKFIVIPARQYNAANYAKKALSSDEKYKLIKSHFYNESGYARVNPIVSKLVNASFNSKGLLFERTYPLEIKRINLDLIDSQGYQSREYANSITLHSKGNPIRAFKLGVITNADWRNIQKPLSYKIDRQGQDNKHYKEGCDGIASETTGEVVESEENSGTLPVDLHDIKHEESLNLSLDNLTEEEIDFVNKANSEPPLSNPTSRTETVELHRHEMTNPLEANISIENHKDYISKKNSFIKLSLPDSIDRHKLSYIEQAATEEETHRDSKASFSSILKDREDRKIERKESESKDKTNSEKNSIEEKVNKDEPSKIRGRRELQGMAKFLKR